MRIRTLWMFVSAIAVLVAMVSVLNLYFAQLGFKDESERLQITHANKENALSIELDRLRADVELLKQQMEIKKSNVEPSVASIIPKLDTSTSVKISPW
jgi:hypothetical protein